MKNLLTILIFIPLFSLAQNHEIDPQFAPFVGSWKNSTKEYETNVEITHEPKFPHSKLSGIASEETTEVLFFDFYLYDKKKQKEIKITSSLAENPISFTAFLSSDQMPHTLIKYNNNSYKYKLKFINKDEIELVRNERPKSEIDFDTKQSRIIPEEPSPIPDRIILKRVKK